MTMTSEISTPANLPARILMWLARLLLGAVGLVIVVSSVYFTFFASTEEGGVVTAFDWFIAVWALLAGAGFVGVAVLIPRSDTYVKAAYWLLLAHLLFGAIKLSGYQEKESLVFFAVDFAILGVLWLGRRHVARSAP